MKRNGKGKENGRWQAIDIREEMKREQQAMRILLPSR